MVAGEVAEGRLPACCISHEFFKAASKTPSKIAVIHARSSARDSRDSAANRLPDCDCMKFASEEMAFSSRPPFYDGDECFTFSDILSAVENLSSRLRRILNGGDDSCLIKPRSDNIISEKSANVSGSMQHPSRNVQQSVKFEKSHTPKVVGIYMEPSVEYIVAVLSILRCGEAFMPLDPTWPKARILSVLSSSHADLVIGIKTSAEGNFHRLDTLQWLIDEGACPVLPVSMKKHIKGQSHPPPLGWPCESESLRSFCYLMYTSGSTGKPKGVCGTEIGLLNRFLWMQEIYPLHEEDVILFKTAISFIDHMQEFLGAVLSSWILH